MVLQFEDYLRLGMYLYRLGNSEHVHYERAKVYH
jgi:hypothetical protein